MDSSVLITISGKDEISDALRSVSDKIQNLGDQAVSTGENTGSLGSALGALGGVALGVVASVVALGAAFVGASVAGLTAATNWGGQLDTLQEVLGMTGEEASGFAGAMNTAGMSVEEGVGSLAIFAKNAENTKDTMAKARDAFGDALDDLKTKNAETLDALTTTHAEAVDKINETWATAQSDAVDKLETIHSNFADKVESIAQGAQSRLAQALQSNADQLADMAKSQAEKQADTQKKIEEDVTRNTEDATTKKNRAIEDLNLQTQAKLATATTEAQRVVIEADAKRQLDKINLDNQRALQDIALKKTRAEQDLADQKARDERAIADQKEKDARSFAELKASEEKKADEQLAQTRRTMLQQEDAVQKSLDRQYHAYEANLKKQDEAFEKSKRKQEEAFEKADKKLEATFEKAQVSSPFEKGLEKLGLSLDQVVDKTGRVNFEPVLTALGKLPEGAERAQVAMELFGRGGAKFLDFIELSKDGLGGVNAMMDKFGLNLSEDQVKALKTYEQSLNMLHMGLDGIATQIGLAVLPMAQGFVDKINKDVIPAVVAWEKGLDNAFKKGGLEGGIQYVTDSLGKLITSAQDYLSKHWDDISKELGKWAGRFWDWVTGALNMLGTKLGELLDAFTKWAKGPDALAKTKEFGGRIGDKIVDAVRAIFGLPQNGTVKSLTDSLTKAIEAAAPILFTLGEQMALHIWDGLKSSLSDWFKDVDKFLFSDMPKQNDITQKKLDWVNAHPDSTAAEMRRAFDLIDAELPAYQTEPGQYRVIPGATNQPVPILAHGGEVIGRLGASLNGVIINFYGTSAPTNASEANQSVDLFLNALRMRGVSIHA